MDISAYILCGGESSRMGSDKALMQFGNQTFIDAPINALKTIEIHFKLVSSHTFHHNIGYNFITDIEHKKGPVSGVTTALKNTKTDWNLILSCDTPLLKTEFLEWLIKNHSKKHEATICLVSERKMPLTAIYHKKCASIFEEHLHKNQLRVMNVIKGLQVQYISVPKELQQQLVNINTPEQLNAIDI